MGRSPCVSKTHRVRHRRSRRSQQSPQCIMNIGFWRPYGVERSRIGWVQARGGEVRLVDLESLAFIVAAHPARTAPACGGVANAG